MIYIYMFKIAKRFQNNGSFTYIKRNMSWTAIFESQSHQTKAGKYLNSIITKSKNPNVLVIDNVTYQDISVVCYLMNNVLKKLSQLFYETTGPTVA